VTERDRDELRRWLRQRLDAAQPEPPVARCLADTERDGYRERLLAYDSPEGGAITAYLLTPPGAGPAPGVVVEHQHASQWHLGKSEPAGLAGDPLQAFGPALARRGIVVLAPDAIGFEDRRQGASGTEPGSRDREQHVQLMISLLLHDRLLMTVVLRDAMAALGVLRGLAEVDADRIGAVGHSFGGSTTLFHAAVDERVAFAAASGCAATYRRRLADGTGIELSQLVPGIATRLDIDDLAGLIAPRPLLLVSSSDDPYAADADDIAAAAGAVYHELGATDRLTHVTETGGHALTPGRFAAIVDWVVATAGAGQA
jgi:dienelactone hydrolase